MKYFPDRPSRDAGFHLSLLVKEMLVVAEEKKLRYPIIRWKMLRLEVCRCDFIRGDCLEI
jgi:hypothetical protein